MKFELVEIKSIKIEPFNDFVYDLEIEDDHSYNVNNIIVHNSACSTRLVTGCGFPQLEAIMRISEVDIPIIADGGIKNSGDIIKALAAGASAVMIGSLFASCPESCAQQIQDEKGNKFKIYRGMASYSAKKDNQINDKYVEGESVLKRLSEPVKNILERLEAGIRSGLSYVGAKNIHELQSKAEFVEISQGTQFENSIKNS